MHIYFRAFYLSLIPLVIKSDVPLPDFCLEFTGLDVASLASHLCSSVNYFVLIYVPSLINNAHVYLVLSLAEQSATYLFVLMLSQLRHCFRVSGTAAFSLETEHAWATAYPIVTGKGNSPLAYALIIAPKLTLKIKSEVSLQ